jgi:hypothetical protein
MYLQQQLAPLTLDLVRHSETECKATALVFGNLDAEAAEAI